MSRNMHSEAAGNARDEQGDHRRETGEDGQQHLVGGVASWLEKYPRGSYAAMVGCIIISAVLAFSVMRPKRDETFKALPSLEGGLTNGMAEFAGTARKLGKLLELQAQLDSMLLKTRLDATDSLVLIDILQEIKQLKISPESPSPLNQNQQMDTINPSRYEHQLP